MVNFAPNEKWSPLQSGAANAFRILCIGFCKYMYLNDYENNFHLIAHTVFMTDHCDS